MSSQWTDRSSRDYQRDASASRHRLAEHLDELNDRLTPGQVFDEVLSYARGGSGTFLRALSNAARDNPVPAMLIGAGCMLFLSEKMGLNRYVTGGDGGSARATAADATERFRSAATGAGQAVSSSPGQMADSVRSGMRSTGSFASEQAASAAAGMRKGAAAVVDTAAGATQSMQQAAHDARDQVADAAQRLTRGAQDATDRLTQGAREMADSVQQYSSAVGGRVAETAAQTRAQAGRAARQIKEQTTSFIHEQPLLSAAIGVALGALLAAALPSTDTEDELMGQTSDSVKEGLGQVASEQFESAKAAAGKVAQRAMDAASREGLTPDEVAQRAREMGEKVKRVVTDTTSAGAAQVREQMNKQS